MFKSILSKIISLQNDPGGVGTSCREIDANLKYLRNDIVERTDKIALRVRYLTNSPDSPFSGMDPDELVACLIAGVHEQAAAMSERLAARTAASINERKQKEMSK